MWLGWTWDFLWEHIKSLLSPALAQLVAFLTLFTTGVEELPLAEMFFLSQRAFPHSCSLRASRFKDTTLVFSPQRPKHGTWNLRLLIIGACLLFVEGSISRRPRRTQEPQGRLLPSSCGGGRCRG
jgi:hypothetical protein